MAGPELLQVSGVADIQNDAIVIGQLLARRDVAKCLDDDAVASGIAIGVMDDDRLTIGCAAMVDPPRCVATDGGVDDVAAIEREQERMAAFRPITVHAISPRMSDQSSLVVNNVRTRWD